MIQEMKIYSYPSSHFLNCGVLIKFIEIALSKIRLVDSIIMNHLLTTCPIKTLINSVPATLPIITILSLGVLSPIS